MSRLKMFGGDSDEFLSMSAVAFLILSTKAWASLVFVGGVSSDPKSLTYLAYTSCMSVVSVAFPSSSSMYVSIGIGTRLFFLRPLICAQTSNDVLKGTAINLAQLVLAKAIWRLRPLKHHWWSACWTDYRMLWKTNSKQLWLWTMKFWHWFNTETTLSTSQPDFSLISTLFQPALSDGECNPVVQSAGKWIDFNVWN